MRLGVPPVKEASTATLRGAGEGALRAVACAGSVLYSGGSDGKLRAWDLSIQPASCRQLQNTHAGAVRAVDAEELSNTVYSAADRTIKVWVEGTG